MNLNSILKNISITSIVLMLSFQLNAQEIGLELYSLRAQFKTDVPGTLSKIKSWDIHEVEGGGTYGLGVDEFKKLLVQNDLRMVAISVDFDDLSKNLQKTIDEAKAFGAKYVVCFWIPHQNNEFTINDVKKAVSIFNTAGKILNEHGLSFCYHPHGYEFRPFEGGTLFDYMVKNTDPRFVNYEMDVYWVKHPGQDPVALLKKYPKRFPLLHLKDRAKNTVGNQNGQADEETNVVLGKGDVGIAAIMKEAKKIGVKHYFIEDESSKSEEQIPASLSYLNHLK